MRPDIPGTARECTVWWWSAVLRLRVDFELREHEVDGVRVGGEDTDVAFMFSSQLNIGSVPPIQATEMLDFAS